MDPKHIALVVVGSKLVPVFARFSEQITLQTILSTCWQVSSGHQGMARMHLLDSVPNLLMCLALSPVNVPRTYGMEISPKESCTRPRIEQLAWTRLGYCHAASIQLRQRPDFDSAGAAPGS